MPTEWRFKAEYIKNCNCAPGCPCDFWAAPTHYKCEGMMAFRILEGKFGNAWFEVLASVISTVLEPKYVPIEFTFDLDARTAKVKFGNDVETTSEPIKNLATGDEHRIRVDMPNGMEYFHPEIATTGILKSTGGVNFDLPPRHSSMAVVDHTHKGLAAQTLEAVSANVSCGRSGP